MTDAEPTSATDAADAPNPSGPWLSRRGFLRAALNTAGAASAAALYAVGVEPQWLKVVRHELAPPRWPAEYDGFTVAHLSDLHHSEFVPIDYLRMAVRMANNQGADLIALTGDYITHDAEWVPAVAEAVSALRAPAGVWAVLGNHDYEVIGPEGRNVPEPRLGAAVVASLREAGVRLLWNGADEIRRRGRPLQIVGLDDFWHGVRHTPGAFVGTDPRRAMLVLNHNPDATRDIVRGWGPDLILSGHTHGGQVNIPFIGPPRLPVSDKRFSYGLYTEGPTRMYVTSGVGSLRPGRFNCRPEIAVLTLRSPRA
jgi:predicted MPP superfamily phosphohydrolase